MHDPDPQVRQAEPEGKLCNDTGGARRVGCAEVADDRDAILDTAPQDGLEQPLEHRFVAFFRIPPLFELGQGHGTFAQHLEKHRRRAAELDQRVDHRAGRVDAIARKTGAVAHPEEFAHREVPVVCQCPGTMHWFRGF